MIFIDNKVLKLQVVYNTSCTAKTEKKRDKPPVLEAEMEVVFDADSMSSHEDVQ